jgi:hypothetical protein
MIESRRTQPKVEQIIPSAARTVGSLRDVGYDAPHAIADLVDNSLTARASHVDIMFHFDGERSWIRVADNGEGMGAATLREAMRYGSERDYSSDDLGKFGFGLKTASTSQCRRLTVASRRAPQHVRMEVRCLDLKHIEETNEWEVLVLEGDGRPAAVTEPLLEHTGTVVLWEDLDRILEYKDPWGEWARRKLLSLAEQMDLHLGMVFHRFLAGEVLGQRLQITVNGRKVQPWDPYCRREPQTEEMPTRDLAVSGDGGTGIVRVQPYVLPRQNEFSSEAEWRRASGPANWNRQQGFYIYRAHRMIQSGGWNRMRTADEHTKLARVSIDFFPDLDSVFEINITKTHVSPPHELRDQLEPVVSQVTRRADQRYRSSNVKGTGGPTTGNTRSPVPPRRNSDRAGVGGGVGRPAGGTTRPVGATGWAPIVPTGASPADSPVKSGGPTITPRKAIEEAAIKAREEKALERIIEALQEQRPEVARDLGW